MQDVTSTWTAVKYVATRGPVKIWEDICDLIIRPPRASYNVASLGPRIFRVDYHSTARYERRDIVVENMRGMKLQCSWYVPLEDDDEPPEFGMTTERTGGPGDGADTEAPAEGGPSPPPRRLRHPRPCVVYLHGNAGGRLDGQEALPVLAAGFTLFTYDASGSGQSDGDYCTLGYYERQDLAAVVEYLHGSRSVTAISLWGRSMGAVTAIMYASRDPSIKCIVCDSPFSRLRDLVHDLVQSRWVPTALVSFVVGQVKCSIASRAALDIDDLDTLKYAALCTATPAFIFHGEDDDFVQPKHSLAVCEAYASPTKSYALVEGDHNSRRPHVIIQAVVKFLKQHNGMLPALA